MVSFPLFHRASGLFFFLLVLAPSALLGETQVTVATFNIEWLGFPRNSGEWYGSRDSQLRAAAGEILAVDADIVALQEIIVDDRNGNALEDLLAELNALDEDNEWDGMHNPRFSFWWDPDFQDFPAQRQAFIWKSSVVRYQGARVLLDWIRAGDNRFGSGRLPFLLQVEVGTGEHQYPLYLVNLHLKCCRGSENRRRRSMTTLIPELQASYADVPVVVLGDFNVADKGGARGEIADWGFYEDDDSDGEPDFFHAAGAVADLSWDDIDHIMMSDELEAAYGRVPEAMQNVIVDSNVSDHGPVVTSLIFEPTLAQRYGAWSREAFPANPIYDGKKGYADDPDEDKLVNYLEFALGGNPTVADTGEVGLRIRRDGEGEFLLSYQFRNTLSEGSIRVRTTTDFAAWSTLNIGETGVLREEESTPEFDRITVTIPDVGEGVEQFFRLEVDTPF